MSAALWDGRLVPADGSGGYWRGGMTGKTRHQRLRR
jgi:hypothetical protein